MKKKRFFIKNVFSEIELINNRIRLSITIITLLLLILLARLVYLSVFEHHYYVDLLQKDQYKLLAVAPNRGLIFDRNGVVLAENIPIFSLYITPDKTTHLEKSLDAINRIIPLTPDEREAFLKQIKLHYKTDDVPLIVNLTEEQRAKFAVNEYQFPEASVKADLLRYYPKGAAFEDIVGYVGRINEADINTINKINYQASNFIGKTGVEKYYESSLHGTVGYRKEEINAFGKIIKQIGMNPPKSGSNLYLTIDSKLQSAAYQAFGNNPGALVAIDPNTGQVLALVSHPGFDPNLFVNGLSEQQYQALIKNPDMPLFNRALRGLYPMASTIKPFFALAALSEHLISPAFILDDPGYFKLSNSNHIFHDWVKGGHGNIDISRAILVSCDTFFYYLANLVGIERMDATLKAFGFGETPNINLPDALGGTVPSPEWKLKTTGQAWYPGDTLITGIGQGFIQATPLQLADGVAALALHGKRIQPNVLLKIANNENQTQFIPPKSLGNVPYQDPIAWQIVINAMKNVIRDPEGTGFRFGRDTAYVAAGKTGTAQVISRASARAFNVIPKDLQNDSLFIVFAPVEHPRIAIAVIAEHSVDAPAIARKVIDAFLKGDST